jgi:hypothetical protein
MSKYLILILCLTAGFHAFELEQLFKVYKPKLTFPDTTYQTKTKQTGEIKVLGANHVRLTCHADECSFSYNLNLELSAKGQTMKYELPAYVYKTSNYSLKPTTSSTLLDVITTTYL